MNTSNETCILLVVRNSDFVFVHQGSSSVHAIALCTFEIQYSTTEIPDSIYILFAHVPNQRVITKLKLQYQYQSNAYGEPLVPTENGCTFGVSGRVDKLTDTAVTLIKSVSCLHHPNS